MSRLQHEYATQRRLFAQQRGPRRGSGHIRVGLAALVMGMVAGLYLGHALAAWGWL